MKRGRPPVDPDDRSVKVQVTLPAKQFDRFCAQALARDESLPEVLRRALRDAELKTKK